MTEITKHIKKLADKGDEIYTVVCKVLAVDAEERTCDVEPLNGDAEIIGVRLQSDLNASTGFLIVPVVGSNVLAAFINISEGYVAMCSKVDYVHLRGDDFGGLIKVEELKTQLAKNTARIDFILEVLKSTITSVALYPNPAWTGIITPLIEALQKESYSDIENTKVNHG